MSRAETGPMKFGDDWCGLFLRGDDCFRFAQALEAVLQQVSPGDDPEGILSKQILKGLLSDLRSTDERNKPEAQKLREFSECLSK